MKTINPLIKAQESYKQAVNNSYTYAGCQTEGCNITKNLIDNFLIADSYKNYWQEQSAGKDVTLTGAAAAIYKAVTPDVIADKVLKKAGLLDEANNYLDIAFNQRTVLDTADTVFFDKFTPYVSNYQRINKQTIDPNKNDLQNYLSAVGAGALDTETRKATIDLGIVITEELAATYAIPVIATGFSGGLITGGTAAFGQFGAMSTTAQTIKAANECITNGVVDEQCQQDSVRAAVSWLSLGTGQAANTVTKAAGFADEAVFLAKGANTIVSAGNLAVDSGDFVDTCTKFGSNQSSFGCTMSYVALVGDLLGGVADYKSGQLGFSGPKIDVPDIDGTRIANAEELALLAKSNSPNVPRPDIPIVELPAAKPVKPINPLANVDIPKAPDTPSVPKKTFTEIFDEKITNPIRNLLPVSKNDKIAYQNALDKLADTNPTKTDITNALLAEGYNPSKINDEVINNTTNELAKINESSPKNQAVTIAIEKINETKINTSPDINDHELVGYQQGSASRIYQPQKDIRTAIENVPDPLNIIKEMKKANTPEEAYTILIKKLEENGVIVIKNPLDENLDIYIPGKEGFSIPIDTPGRYLGAYYDTTEAIDFSTYTSSSVEFLDEPRKSYIFLHPQFDSLPIGTRIKTLLHETGHYIEQVQLPGVINPNVKTLKFPDGRSAIERPTTEYVSSLYGANGALISAKFGGSQAAIDAGLVAQIELNAKVLGNPDGYLPKADIPKP
ncbi:MAG: hypothetical protein Q8O68_00850, partial [Candidatus Daviesbacteria bacterium]|nr:hypothetical protein [Candidatus Daviesbacteria bacterium]